MGSECTVASGWPHLKKTAELPALQLTLGFQSQATFRIAA